MTEKSAAELEREAERARASVADTAETLRSKMTPGQMVDEFTGMLSHGDSGAAFRNLKNQVRDNPLPLALVGAGLAWLMFGSGPSASRIRSASSRRFDSYGNEDWDDDEIWDDEAWEDEVASSDFGSDTAASNIYGADRYASSRTSGGYGSSSGGDDDESLVDKATGAAHSAMSKAGDLVGGAKDTLTGARDSMGRAASGLGRKAGSVRKRAGSFGKSARGGLSHQTESIGRAGRRMRGATEGLIEREPLVLAAIGLAAGAAIGALLPRTRMEQEHLGEYGKKLRDTGEEFLEKGIHDAKDVASEAYRTAKQEADRQGLTPGGDGSLVDKVANVAKATATKTEEAAREKASKMSDDDNTGRSPSQR